MALYIGPIQITKKRTNKGIGGLKFSLLKYKIKNRFMLNTVCV